MIAVFDASALVAYLRDEPSAVPTRTLLLAPGTKRIVHAVNLCEVYYRFFRELGEADAEAAIAALEGTGLETRSDIDRAFWQDVGRVKADVRRVSLGDCFLIALARRVEGTVVTADHAEFDTVAGRGICPVLFIR